MGKLLIAGGTAPFAGWLAGHLQSQGHQVRVTATSAPTTPLPAGVEFVLCQLGHEDEYSLGEAVYFGCEQIVLLTNCTAFGSPDASWLDVATRQYTHNPQHTLINRGVVLRGVFSGGNFNLLCAACAREVRRVIVVSCIDVFSSYAKDLAVDENFRPRPSLAPTQLQVPKRAHRNLIFQGVFLRC